MLPPALWRYYRMTLSGDGREAMNFNRIRLPPFLSNGSVGRRAPAGFEHGMMEIVARVGSARGLAHGPTSRIRPGVLAYAHRADDLRHAAIEWRAREFSRATQLDEALQQ